MREDGLNCSERMLEADTKNFIAFFNEIKEETTKAAKEVDDLKKQKNAKTAKFREIQEEYNALVSSINKNVESLQLYYSYKQFLDQLRPMEEQKMMEERRKAKLQKKDEEKKRREQVPFNSN